MLIFLLLCIQQYTLCESKPSSQGYSFHEALEEFHPMLIMSLYQLIEREDLDIRLH